MKQTALSINSTHESEEKDKHHQQMPSALLKVLIVEDSLPEQMRLKIIILKNGYEVFCATNGKEALELMAKEQIHIVVSDWRMPQLTGIELCKTLRSEPVYGQPYFILLTGFNTQTDLISGMDAGADDFISKPVSTEELRVRLQAGARILQLRNELELQNQQLEVALTREEEVRQSIQQDLDAAARMQQELLPDGQSPLPQLEIGTLFKPAVTVAGDSYGYFKLDDDHMVFYHLDVAGHGIASAMLSFTLSRFLSPALADGLLREIVEDSDDSSDLAPHIMPPHLVVASLNQKFQESQECIHYFTMVYGVFNVKTGRGEFCQAGHPHPLFITKDGSVNKLGDGGFAVGMFDHATYESVPFEMDHGDRIAFYSDGITDTTNKDGEAFGFDRYKRLLEMGCRLPIAVTIDALDTILHQWKGDQDFDDDVSLLMFEYKNI